MTELKLFGFGHSAFHPGDLLATNEHDYYWKVRDPAYDRISGALCLESTEYLKVVEKEDDDGIFK